MKPSLDLVARRVVMASMIYYGLDMSIVGDGEYDSWCKRLAKRWDRLDRFRQWQLGSAEELSASGFHVKVTYAALYGAIDWMRQEGLWPEGAKVLFNGEWDYSKRHRVRWLTPDKFTLEKPRKIKRARIREEIKPEKKSKRVRLGSKTKRVRL